MRQVYRFRLTTGYFAWQLAIKFQHIQEETLTDRLIYRVAIKATHFQVKRIKACQLNSINIFVKLKCYLILNIPFVTDYNTIYR